MKRKATITIRGKTLGGASPLVCAPLVAPDAARLLAEARAVLARKPDVLEWRVDHFADIADTGAVLDAGRKLRRAIGETPLIFTRRSTREGGQPTALRGNDVVELYAAVGAASVADFVDFEMGNDTARVRQVVADAHRHRLRVILSYHNFRRTPPARTLRDRFLEAQRLGADVAKVAVMPRDRRDVLTFLQAMLEAEAKSRIPLIGMSMGPLGAVTRVVGGLFGSSLTFAVGQERSAPGQVPIAELRAALEILDRASRG